MDQARKDGEDGVEKARQEAEDVRHELESIRQEKEEAEEKFSAQEQVVLQKNNVQFDVVLSLGSCR